ncbi:flagellar biosynthesis anti-sigma factor FlgM [Endozoicomonas numazuensis]|uniref:Uncharacterized protein n=1 Tax=Endozoicomonas numazuensis TaxID=1137799 RepID=A0A081NJJ1_9GAMM|nr:flagellar biosynthesis anti-sigma factor FlgM [Endozoicomonas numazuensis]KEQ18614.1 hypothetical protein GZ78_00275 [Endozoicomonas numazuensis]
MDDSRKNETESRSSIPNRHTEARLLALRKAYLAGELKVDSARVADKLLTFESTLENHLKDKNS